MDEEPDQGVRRAEAWIEPRLLKAYGRLRQNRRAGRPTEARLVIPYRVIRLYEPYLSWKTWPSGSVRRLMARHDIRTDMRVADGRRGSLVVTLSMGWRR